MQEIPPKSHTWTSGGIFLESIEAILREGRSTDVDAPQWHADAILASQHLTANHIFDSAQTLLNEAPYTQMLEALTPDAISEKRAIKRLRRGRRLFQIARDGIILTTRKNSSTEFCALRGLCISLGNISTGDKDDTIDVQRATDALSLLQDMDYSDTHLHDTSVMLDKVAKYIHTESLVRGEPLPNVGPDVYHKWRKDFRRVTNMFVLEGARQPGSSLAHFAAQGVALNKAYGEGPEQDAP